MTQDERRIWLIQQLQKEMPENADIDMPEDPEQQWRLLRGLFNVRPAAPASEAFLRIQDEYLRGITRQKGIVDVSDLKPCHSDARLYLWQGDITVLRCDAIVNAANSGMTGCYVPNHNCIDNIIHTMAGVELREKCYQIMKAQGHEEPTGTAKITPGYNLPARYVIHTVGPLVSGWLTGKDKELLASCYRSVLSTASGHQLESVAFCCISTGVFHFPQDKAAEIAVCTVRGWLDAHPETSVRRVIFNVFKDSDRGIYRKILYPSETSTRTGQDQK